MLPVLIQGEKHFEPEAWLYLISRMAPGKEKTSAQLSETVYRESVGGSKANWPDATEWQLSFEELQASSALYASP